MPTFALSIDGSARGQMDFSLRGTATATDSDLFAVAFDEGRRMALGARWSILRIVVCGYRHQVFFGQYVARFVHLPCTTTGYRLRTFVRKEAGGIRFRRTGVAVNRNGLAKPRSRFARSCAEGIKWILHCGVGLSEARSRYLTNFRIHLLRSRILLSVVISLADG